MCRAVAPAGHTGIERQLPPLVSVFPSFADRAIEVTLSLRLPFQCALACSLQAGVHAFYAPEQLGRAHGYQGGGCSGLVILLKLLVAGGAAAEAMAQNRRKTSSERPHIEDAIVDEK
jgi:hypothetical protein